MYEHSLNPAQEIHIHVHIQTNDDPRIDQILTAINRLAIEERYTMADLSELTAQVTANTDVVGSAIAMISGLADKLEAASTDPAAVQDLANTLRTNNQALADAVAANTPVAPPVEEPPVTEPPAA